MATRGRRCTSTWVCPVAASAATAAGPTLVPAGSSGSPWRMSLPARRMCAPGAAAVRTLTRAGRAVTPVVRIGLLHGHDGVGALGHHGAGEDANGSAGRHRATGSVPGRDLSADGEAHGASRSSPPATSALRTAKPSIALLSQGGSVRRATVSSASTRPRASAEHHLLGAQRQDVAKDALPRFLEAQETLVGHRDEPSGLRAAASGRRSARPRRVAPTPGPATRRHAPSTSTSTPKAAATSCQNAKG